MTEQVTIQDLREKAFEIYLRHLCENRLNPVFTESQVAVNAMMDFYEQMKNKDNGNQTSTIH